MKYAERTSVPVEKSEAEIKKVIQRYGAEAFGSLWDQRGAQILFVVHGKQIKFVLPLPDRKAERFWKTPGRGHERSEDQAYQAWEQECRQRWRALALAIKAKLEAVETGITTFEAEFLSHIVLPNGRTVQEEVLPRLEEAYASGKMPTLTLLPA